MINDSWQYVKEKNSKGVYTPKGYNSLIQQPKFFTYEIGIECPSNSEVCDSLLLVAWDIKAILGFPGVMFQVPTARFVREAWQVVSFFMILESRNGIRRLCLSKMHGGVDHLKSSDLSWWEAVILVSFVCSAVCEDEQAALVPDVMALSLRFCLVFRL